MIQPGYIPIALTPAQHRRNGDNPEYRLSQSKDMLRPLRHGHTDVGPRAAQMIFQYQFRPLIKRWLPPMLITTLRPADNDFRRY